MQNCKFQDGTAKTGGGGAVYVDVTAGTSNVNVSLSNTTFTYNASANSGGAVFANGTCANTLNVSGCVFNNNRASLNGGGIDTYDQLTVVGGSFTGNQAQTGEGGAVYYSGNDAGAPQGVNPQMVLGWITFANNNSATKGGAVSAHGSTGNNLEGVTVSNCLFEINYTATDSSAGGDEMGGGLYISDDTESNGSASASVINCTFQGNDSFNGGAIALDNLAEAGGINSVTLTSLTVYENGGDGADGGGLWVSAFNSAARLAPQITNFIIADNLIDNVPADGPDVFGTVASQGYNLIGITDGSTGWLPPPPQNPAGDRTGTSASPMDPGLDPNGLANNGGPTLTIKLLTTSAGYHTGNPNSNGTVDQRGYVRPNPLKNLPVSMGAYDPDAKPKQLGLLQPPATDTELTASADPAAPGQPVTLTATLFPADDGTPTGPVEFMDGDAVLATVDLSVVDGVSQAAFTTSDLALGVDTITAVYGGDDSEAGSTSSPLTLTVQQTPTWVGVVSSADPQWPDEPVTFTADVVGDDGGSPTGTVTFMAGDTALGTATLSSQDGYSQATFTVSALPLGSYDITAVYGGDDTYAPASSDTLTQIVGYATSTYLTSSADPSSPGQAVTFTASRLPSRRRTFPDWYDGLL